MDLRMGRWGSYSVVFVAPLVLALTGCESRRSTEVVVSDTTTVTTPSYGVVASDPVVTFSPSRDAMTDAGMTERRYSGWNSSTEMVKPDVIYGPGNYHDPSRPIR